MDYGFGLWINIIDSGLQQILTKLTILIIVNSRNCIEYYCKAFLQFRKIKQN